MFPVYLNIRLVSNYFLTCYSHCGKKKSTKPGERNSQKVDASPPSATANWQRYAFTGYRTNSGD